MIGYVLFHHLGTKIKCVHGQLQKKNVNKYIERKTSFNELEFKIIKANLLSKNIGMYIIYTLILVFIISNND